MWLKMQVLVVVGGGDGEVVAVLLSLHQLHLLLLQKMAAASETRRWLLGLPFQNSDKESV